VPTLEADGASLPKACRPAADRGNAEAQDMLGTMYDHGEGVPKNYSEAVKWYHRAADQGNADAQSHLGLMYAAGEGVPRDYVRAHKWLNLSAARGNNFAIKYRDNIAGRMTPVQIAEAQKLAREWKPKPER
jgi:TPR repeat protein